MLNDALHAAFRLFNGFLEGDASLAIDVYGRTALLHDYAQEPRELGEVVRWLTARLDWLDCVIVKRRSGQTDEERRGRIVFGNRPTRKIREHGVWYAVDLLMNRDASFYLDTRLLRRWLLDNMAGKSVLNTFAYTGSLGVAATAAGASRVVQTDLNKRFLNVAKTSYSLNGFPIYKRNFIAGDFWSVIKRMNRANEQFDCVILDPPFFAETTGGRVDLAQNMTRLINKVRPIVHSGGHIVAVNNALFVSGAEYMAELKALGAGGYVAVSELIDVGEDFVPDSAEFITNPAPFKHTTKIAVLEVRHNH